jgi:hypothetical protein
MLGQSERAQVMRIGIEAKTESSEVGIEQSEQLKVESTLGDSRAQLKQAEDVANKLNALMQSKLIRCR